MTVLGIIPARGGSRRIHRKNLTLLGGKPLLWHTFSACAGSRLLDAYVVSTEDEEIAAYAHGQGVAVVARPAALARDGAGNIPVWRHSLEAAAGEFGRAELFVNLNPTSPLRTAADIDDAVRLLTESGCDAVFGVTRVAIRPDKIHRLDGDGRMTFCWPHRDEARIAAKQDAPPYFVPNGAVTAARAALLDGAETWADAFLRDGLDLRALVMPRERSVDVDEPIDLALCSYLLGDDQPVPS